jgi:hypothetical protein
LATALVAAEKIEEANVEHKAENTEIAAVESLAKRRQCLN